jgi:hypothetical protein
MSGAQYETFTVDVCVMSNDPGCLGWPDADHEGECRYEAVECHICTECRADDVYGQLIHEPSCSQYVVPEVPL